MALQSSGQIKLTEVAGEFGGSAPHTLKEYYGVASGVPSSGEITLKDFYGKSNLIVRTASNNQTNRNLSSIFGSSNWSSSTPKEYQVPNGVNIGGTGNSNTQAAIRVPTGMGGTLKIVVAGTVTGHGGDRGAGGVASTGSSNNVHGEDATNGGHAIYIQSNGVTLQVKSSGKVRGGGGGGGGGAAGGKYQGRKGGNGGRGGHGRGWNQSKQNGAEGGNPAQLGGGFGGEGGNGGDYGQNGQDGQTGQCKQSSPCPQAGERGLKGNARKHASGKSSSLDNEGGQVQG